MPPLGQGIHDVLVDGGFRAAIHAFPLVHATQATDAPAVRKPRGEGPSLVAWHVLLRLGLPRQKREKARTSSPIAVTTAVSIVAVAASPPILTPTAVAVEVVAPTTSHLEVVEQEPLQRLLPGVERHVAIAGDAAEAAQVGLLGGVRSERFDLGARRGRGVLEIRNGGGRLSDGGTRRRNDGAGNAEHVAVESRS